jgi:hypothetical protein
VGQIVLGSNQIDLQKLSGKRTKNFFLPFFAKMSDEKMPLVPEEATMYPAPPSTEYPAQPYYAAGGAAGNSVSPDPYHQPQAQTQQYQMQQPQHQIVQEHHHHHHDDHMDHPFLYRATPSCCTRCLLYCSLIVMCLYPFVLMSLLTETISKMVVRGVRFRFTGAAGEFCCDVWCINWLLTIVTAGLWTCCGCAEERRNKWIDSHIEYV